jgi:hypothetical protein
MGSTLQMVGFWRLPLAMCFGLVVVLGVWSAARLLRSGAVADPRTRVWVDATLFWGLFALICGGLGGVMGVTRVFQGFEAAGGHTGPCHSTKNPVVHTTTQAIARHPCPALPSTPPRDHHAASAAPDAGALCGGHGGGDRGRRRGGRRHRDQRSTGGPRASKGLRPCRRPRHGSECLQPSSRERLPSAPLAGSRD